MHRRIALIEHAVDFAGLANAIDVTLRVYQPKPSFVGGSGTASPFTGAHWAVANTQPLYGGSIKGSFIRAPSAPQGYFAGEQIVDELAHANNIPLLLTLTVCPTPATGPASMVW